jgi:hypothetical protein
MERTLTQPDIWRLTAPAESSLFDRPAIGQDRDSNAFVRQEVLMANVLFATPQHHDEHPDKHRGVLEREKHHLVFDEPNVEKEKRCTCGNSPTWVTWISTV